MPGENAEIQGKPFLAATERKYGFQAEELVKRLGLEGKRVTRIESDGLLFYVVTTDS